jgi:hypothetical protein
MADKQAVLRESDDAYMELRQAFGGLGESDASQVWLGTWGVREILIHISGWHREMIPALDHIGRGERPYPEGVSYNDADGWNARFVQARRDAKLVDILAELDASHRDFVSAAAALGDEHFEPGAEARELFEGAGSQHYREHAGQIRRWRRNGAGWSPDGR